MNREIKVLRLGHRPCRDERMTTHVGLVARAFGADGVLLDKEDDKVKESILDVLDRFGGDLSFGVIGDWEKFLDNWEGVVIHLSMYGQKIQDVEDELKRINKDILIVLGSQKVPSEVYKIADYNVAVTNQPHSEVAALAILLDRLFGGKELEKRFEGDIEIVPSEGKKVVKEKD